ncbi:MAG: multiheme c-type cytochrome, partial [Candidatus Rifleibacteriota bacterium]
MIKKLMLLMILSIVVLPVLAQSAASDAVTSDESARCLNCHYERQKKLVESWEKSSHARNRVGCFECHQADPADPAAKKGHFGFTVQLQISPLRCAECHPAQYASFASSTHAMAYETIRNAELASTSPVLFETSCAICHGNDLKMTNGKPAPHKWPNHGIGRINTDGSRGNCVACHGHHDYSLAVARSAETCGRCHHGATGPAHETWKASKHGSNWNLAKVHADFNSTGLIPSQQHLHYPDCYVCHVAPTQKDGKDSTHNPGDRLSWKLAAMKSTFREDWGQKRLKMQNVCRSCHGNSQVDQFYRRYDAAVMQINKIAAAAAQNAGDDRRRLNAIKAGAITARLGAAMLGPL